jgi:hypothetical protein
VRQPITLADAFDALPRSSAREDHPVVVVEDDDGLSALLDECARPYPVCVHSRASF